MFKGLKALVAGVVAGTALGIFFSPKKGKELRKGIKSEVKKGGTGLDVLKDTVVEMGKDIGETCKECYEDLSDTEEFQEGKKKATEYAKMAKTEATKAYKKNVPLKTRRKVKKTVKKAKASVEKAKKQIKKAKK